MTNSKDKLAQIRALLNEQQNQQNNNSNSRRGPSLVYPFWNIPVDGATTVRFLPDGNSDNPLLWLESNTIRLAFDGIKGMAPKSFELRVPCVEMWGDACPVLGHIRKEKWFDDEETKALGSQYWKKRSWITHGFVTEDGVGETNEDRPENPIRHFAIGFQLFQLIKSGVLDPDLEDSPDDIEAGTDFVIRKTSQGGQANYTTSAFKRKGRSLNDAERAAMDEFGVPDLEKYRPKKPSTEELEDIFKLFQASLAGDMYDADKFGHLPWRPRGVSNNSGEEAPASTPTASDLNKVKDETPEVETPSAPAASSTDAQSILAKVRARNNS